MDTRPASHHDREDAPPVLLGLPLEEEDDAPPAVPPEPVLLFREPDPPRYLDWPREWIASAVALLARVRRRWDAEKESRDDAPGMPLRELPPAAASTGHAMTLAGGGRVWEMDTVARPDPRPSVQPVEEEPVSLLTKGLAWVFCAVWAVLGLIYWLPVLLVTVVRFTVAHLEAMLDGRIPEAAAGRLRSAISFYARGFDGALGLARHSAAEGGGPEPSGRSLQAPEPLPLGSLARSTAWAAVAWYPLLLIVGIVEWPPLSLQSPALEGTWTALPGIIGDGIAAAVSDVLHVAARAGESPAIR